MPGVEQGFKLALLTYFEMNLATSKVETSAQCLPLNRRQEVNWRSGDNAIIFFSFTSFSSLGAAPLSEMPTVTSSWPI